jgi:hypothetical protein
MPNPRTLPALLVAIAVVATLGVAGCGSESDETSGGGTKTAPVSAGDEARRAGGAQAPAGVRAEVCESDDAAGGELRVTGVPCEFGRKMVEAWSEEERCAAPPGASRTSCKIGGFTCLGTATGRGLAVTCAAPGSSLVFLAKQS